MSTFSTISDIISGGSGDVSELATTLESELPVAFAEEANTHSPFTHTSTSYGTIDTDTVAVEADELLIVVSKAIVSASDATDTWIVTHSVAGAYKGTAHLDSFRDANADSDGKASTLTTVTFWQDQSAGNLAINLEVKADSAASGTFYCHRSAIYTLRLKRR